MQLPEHFTKNIRQFFKNGEKWLHDLPQLITYCEKRWKLTVHEPFKLSFNYVAPATTDTGDEVVLKLSVPNEEAVQELEALKIFNGDGINKVLDYDVEKGIMILERIHPGKMLSTVKDEIKAVKISSRVIQNVWKLAPTSCNFPTTEDRGKSLKAYANKYSNGYGPISNKTLQMASETFEYLNETTNDKHLLHGDFHQFNVLSHHDDWIAIDPKGLIGEREYDLTQYMLNCLPETISEKAATIDLRATHFAKELSLNKSRILLWSFCHSVLSLCWSIVDEASDETYDTTAMQALEQLTNQIETTGVRSPL